MSARIIEFVPLWPIVRCSTCCYTFEVGPSPRSCPHCGGVKFVTLMDGLRTEITEPDALTR